MKILKKYLNVLSLLCVCLSVCGSILRPAVTYASPYDLLISTDSNASTFSLQRSALGTVTNTIDPTSKVRFSLFWYDEDGKRSESFYDAKYVDGRWTFNAKAPGIIDQINIFMDSKYNAIPRPGTYKFSFDLASDFGFEYSQLAFRGHDSFSNVAADDFSFVLSNDLWSQYSGDLYISPLALKIGSLDYLWLRIIVPASQSVTQVGGSFSIRFVNYDGEAVVNLGSDTSTVDYQSGVSSSLSDLSSSVDSMTEDLSSAAESLEYISTSQNLIIQGIDNVIMHISDQLYAFWDQLYNLIHEPTYAKLEEILGALRAIANNSDIYQVVEEMRASNNKVIANDNKLAADQIANDEANTEEVKDAVKEHGNFIIDGLKGLFIPSDEFFKAYFDDLYSYFSDRFGFLSFPIDLVIRIADLFLTSEKVDAVLTLPSFEISGYKVWEDYSFNFTEFLEASFPFLISAIQTVTSIGLIMAFVNLCQDKWNEVMRS